MRSRQHGRFSRTTPTNRLGHRHPSTVAARPNGTIDGASAPQSNDLPRSSGKDPRVGVSGGSVLADFAPVSSFATLSRPKASSRARSAATCEDTPVRWNNRAYDEERI